MPYSTVTKLRLDHLEMVASQVLDQVSKRKCSELFAIQALAGQLINLIDVVRELYAEEANGHRSDSVEIDNSEPDKE